MDSGPRALAWLNCRFGDLEEFRDAAWHQEVHHAEVVRRAADGSGTRGTRRRCQEAQGNGEKGAARPDLAQARRRRAELDRRADRRSVLVPDEDGRKASTTISRAGIR